MGFTSAKWYEWVCQRGIYTYFMEIFSPIFWKNIKPCKCLICFKPVLCRRLTHSYFINPADIRRISTGWDPRISSDFWQMSVEISSADREFFYILYYVCNTAKLLNFYASFGFSLLPIKKFSKVEFINWFEEEKINKMHWCSIILP